MKRLLFIILIVTTVNVGFGQTDKAYQAALDSVSAMVIHYLQTKQTDSLYALAGTNFKNQLNAETFKTVSENQIFPLNNFAQVTFINTANRINKYKVAGTPDLQLLISLDKDNKLETFLIQPFSNN